MTDVHTHDHRSVLRSDRRRTAATSAAYLVPALERGARLLDVGCGRGSITVDLARLVAPGSVVAVDRSQEALAATADAVREAGLSTVVVEPGDVYELPFPDASFDVVHAHQLLHHLSDPVAALREMRRVTRTGGLVAVRDVDHGAMRWHPASTGMDDWSALHHEVVVAGGAHADAGRRLLSWVLAAGFDAADVTPSASAWCYATPEDRDWWSSSWAERVTSSDFAAQALAAGLADDVALEALADAWLEWGSAPDAWFTILHGEVLARV